MQLVQRELWVCFDCRKMFRPRYAQAADATERTAETLCPQCRAPMRRVGRYFKPPRRRDGKQWAKVRLLLEAGVDFSGYAPRPPKRLSEAAAYLSENRRTPEAERLLQTIARRSARQKRRQRKP